jgi:hypothetical protein
MKNNRANFGGQHPAGRLALTFISTGASREDRDLEGMARIADETAVHIS